MCNTHVGIALGVCFSLIFRLFTLGLLLIYVAFCLDTQRAWEQMKDFSFVIILVASMISAVGLVPDIAVYFYCKRYFNIECQKHEQDGVYEALFFSD